MNTPKRLIDPTSGTSKGLRDLLEAGRSELPSADRLRGLGERLAPMIACPAPGPAAGGTGASPGAAVSAAHAAAWWKAGLAVVCVTVAGSGIALHRSESRRNVAGPSAPSVTIPAQGAPARAVAHETPAEPPLPEAPATPSAPRQPEAPPHQAIARSSQPGGEETEIDLLRHARASLATTPSHALAVAELHAVRFPLGVLAEEREVIAIDALVRLGRRPEARARADRFFVLHPSSAYRPRIEALLGDRDAGS